MAIDIVNMLRIEPAKVKGYAFRDVIKELPL